MELKCYPYLEHEDNHLYDINAVSDVMSYPVVTMKKSDTAGNIVHILNTTSHNGFPVVDDFDHLLGIVRRDQLVALLECGIYEETSPWFSKEFQYYRNVEPFPSHDVDSSSLTVRLSRSATNYNDLQKEEEILVEDDLRFSFYAQDDDEISSDAQLFEDSRIFQNHVKRDSTLMNLALLIRDDRYTSNDKLSPIATNSLNSFRTNCSHEYESTTEEETNDEWLRDNVRSLPNNTLTLGPDESLPLCNILCRNSKTAVRIGDGGKLLVDLNPNEYNKHIDIQAVMSRASHCVVENCPLSSAFKTFTVLGLRHLCVLGNNGGKRQGKVVGILSRSNLCQSYINEKLNIVH